MKTNIHDFDVVATIFKEDGHSICICFHRLLSYFLLDNENLVIDYNFDDAQSAISMAELYEYNDVDYLWEVRL